MIRSILPLAILALATTCVAQSVNTCPLGWFGRECSYQCNCNASNVCSSDGACQDDQPCKKGWFGPACQYVDLTAKSTVTRTRSQSLPERVRQPCFGAAGLLSVNVALGGSYHVTWLRLTFLDPGFLDGVSVAFKNNSLPTTCLNQSSSPFSDKTLDIHCPSGVSVNQVALTGGGIKALCDVFISGGRNVALKQPNVTLSSIWDTNTADKAVDGDSSGNFSYCSCTDGRVDSSPSWTLLFSRPHQIHRFDLYNRIENNDRLQRFTINAFVNESTSIFNKSTNSPSQLTSYSVTPDVLLQDILKVQISSTIRYFTICEAVISGDGNCPIGTFGRDCESTCNCAVKEEACFVSTGGCPSGCTAGFHGYGCSSPCPQHLYGVDCKNSCSQRCSNQSCNSVSGVCFQCEPGKQGDFCDQACDPGRYGQGCSGICPPNCFGDDSCDGETGFCPACKDGFKGNVCNETCQTHHFGAGCLLTCSANCTNQTCHHVSGACYSCVPGLQGTFCDRAFLAQPAPDNSTGLIAGLVVAAVVLIIVIVVVLLVFRRRRNANGTGKNQWNKQNGDVQVIFNETKSANGSEEESQTDENELEIVGEVPYYNFVKAETPIAIKVTDLHSFLLSHDEGFFKSQFETVPNINPEATTYVALSDGNKSKNRYKNICPYDHSRVCLTINSENKEDDYINASYIEGYKKKEKFIASQGPNKTIVNDFVRMLWEQKIDKVVMLTHLIEEGKQKCERYWPEDNQDIFGEIQVTLAATQVFADYTIRKLRLKKDGGTSHNVTHFHFTSWPDKGVPTTPWSLVDFEQRVFACPTTKPVVVHCSAGVGRTGTFIALHNVIKEAVETGQLDFYNTLVGIRKDRMNMIQTAAQYTFLHRAAEVALLCLETTISSKDIASRIQFLETRMLEMTRMEKEFNSICDVYIDHKYDIGESESDDGINMVYENSRTIVNKQKNRFSNILSNDLYRPHLNDVEGGKADDYINAVLVPSFTKACHQILTQLPLPTTVTEFWRLVTQYKVSLIVAFEQDMKATDLTIGDYLPSEENEPFNTSLFQVQTKSSISGQFWLQQNLLITTNTLATNNEESALYRAEQHQVTHLKCTSTDLEPTQLLALAEKIKSHNSSENGRTLFMCRNGATYSGLVYVLTLLLDRMDNDNQLTIPLVVGTVKAIRPQVIPTVEQYRVLYAVLGHYCDSASVYCNIGSSNPKP